MLEPFMCVLQYFGTFTSWHFVSSSTIFEGGIFSASSLTMNTFSLHMFNARVIFGILLDLTHYVNHIAATRLCPIIFWDLYILRFFSSSAIFMWGIFGASSLTVNTISLHMLTARVFFGTALDLTYGLGQVRAIRACATIFSDIHILTFCPFFDLIWAGIFGASSLPVNTISVHMFIVRVLFGSALDITHHVSHLEPLARGLPFLETFTSWHFVSSSTIFEGKFSAHLLWL